MMLVCACTSSRTCANHTGTYARSQTEIVLNMSLTVYLPKRGSHTRQNTVQTSRCADWPMKNKGAAGLSKGPRGSVSGDLSEKKHSVQLVSSATCSIRTLLGGLLPGVCSLCPQEGDPRKATTMTQHTRTNDSLRR